MLGVIDIDVAIDTNTSSQVFTPPAYDSSFQQGAKLINVPLRAVNRGLILLLTNIDTVCLMALVEWVAHSIISSD